MKILEVKKAEYLGGYSLRLYFNNNEIRTVNLKETIFNDHRKIFEPLRDVNYFSTYSLDLNTITWKNNADFAPEFLFQIGST
jgi:hypothetical protein